jgi:hypothetical protein
MKVVLDFLPGFLGQPGHVLDEALLLGENRRNTIPLPAGDGCCQAVPKVF